MILRNPAHTDLFALAFGWGAAYGSLGDTCDAEIIGQIE